MTGRAWLVSACCALVSAVLVLRAFLIGVTFEPTTKALYDAYVVRPQVTAAGVSLGVSLLLLALLMVARVGRTALGLVVVLNVLAVGTLTLRSWQESDRRAHPDGRLLAALHAIPLDPGWVVVEPATVHREANPIEHTAYPEGALVLATRSTNRDAVCATLVPLLRARGWQPDGYDACSLSKHTSGVSLRVSVTNPPDGAPTLVQVAATPIFPVQG